MEQLKNGSFIKVKKDCEFRPGQDGMVMWHEAGHVGMIFGFDRYNRMTKNVFSTGIEAFDINELDLTTIEN